MALRDHLVLALIAALTVARFGVAHSATLVRICDDEEGWPPYVFADPTDTRKDANLKRVTGANTEVLVEVLKRAGYEAKISLLPWKRCLAEVESGDFAMLMNATYSDERKQKFLMSKPLYSINGGIFFLKGKHLDIKGEDDLKKYKYCGRAGFNYTMYTTIPPGNIDSGTRGLEAQYDKLRLGYCDAVLDDIEIAKGFARMGKLNLDGIESMIVPGAKPKNFHAMVSKAVPGGEALVKAIDNGIEQLKQEGTYAKIYSKYGI